MNIFSTIFRLIQFLLFYVGEVFLSTFRVAHDVLTPKDYANPAIIAFPLDAKTDFEILALANLISMTPGTLSIDVSTDRKVLYIHAMFVDDQDVEMLKKDLKVTLENKVLKLFRGSKTKAVSDESQISNPR